MEKTKNEIKKYLNKKHKSEKDQRAAFMIMISKIFSYIEPAVPDIEKLVLNKIKPDQTIQFSMSEDMFVKCVTTCTPLLSTVHVPPTVPFIMTPIAKQPPTYEDLSNHIALLLSQWVATGSTPASSPTIPLVLT